MLRTAVAVCACGVAALFSLDLVLGGCTENCAARSYWKSNAACWKYVPAVCFVGGGVLDSSSSLMCREDEGETVWEFNCSYGDCNKKCPGYTFSEADGPDDCTLGNTSFQRWSCQVPS